MRPKRDATVSTPLKWEEVKAGLSIKEFNIKSVINRFSEKGDLFKNVLKTNIDMHLALTNLEQ